LVDRRTIAHLLKYDSNYGPFDGTVEVTDTGIAAGGNDDGPPGPRPQYGKRYYAAYLRDPDGLRVEIVSRR
ncbi:MAG TPA: hypothetical protein VFN55_11085, partial [Solirubrobacteraceae bacterium]|nr:hypothetical protein [Solirubrobacteraceae bacterium]